MAKTEFNIVGKFDISQITKGITEIKKQISNQHIGEELRKQLQESFTKLEVKLPQLEKFAGKDTFSTKELEQYQKLIAEIQKDMLKFNNIVDSTNFKDFISQEDTNKLKDFDDQIQKVEDRISSLRKEMIEAFSKQTGISIQGETMQNAIEQLFSVEPDQVRNKFNEIKQNVVQESEKAQEDIQNALLARSKKFEKNSDVISFLFGEGSNVTIKHGMGGAAVETLQQVKMAIQDLAAGNEVQDFSEKLQRLYELVSQTGEFEGAFKNPNGEESIFGKLKVDATEVTAELDKLEPKLDEIEKISKEKLTFINEAEAEKIGITAQKAKFLDEVLNSLVKSEKITKEEAEKLAEEFIKQGKAAAEGAEQMRQQKIQTDALNNTFGTLAHRIEYTVSAMAIFNKSMQIVRSAIKSVEDLDAAFTQIAIVSEQSGEAAWKMFERFNNLAKQYSITTKDLTEGAKLFYQQGLNAADTMKMVEASTISAALGEVTMSEAANTLTAAIQGYNESASVAMDYTDKIAMVGAVSAADFNELSAAMEKTASSAYTAGIDFDHLLGYLGKMIEVTREAPANLGTAMKTIIARFEDMKKDPMAILEDGVSANKVEAALATIGIALRDSEGEFRALQDVMDELGIKWETLTRNQQAYIATVAAGSRQQSRFLAMMNDYDRTLDLIAESQNSAGAAAKQYATYQDSIAAAQARLAASWEKFYSKIVDNDIIKFVINGLSEILDLLSKVPPAITAIGTAIGALQLQKIISSKGGIIGILEKILRGNIFKKIAGEAGEDIANELASGISKGTPTILSSFKDIKNVMNKSLTSIISGLKTAGTALMGFASAHPIAAAAIAVIATTIGMVTYKLQQQKREYKEAAEKMRAYTEEYENLTSRTNNAKNLLDTYEDLSKKISLTDEEQTTLNNTIDELKDLYPELITATNNYGEAEIANIKVLQDRIMAEEKLAKIQKQKALESQRDMLSKDTKEWNQDDIAQISAKYAAQFFNAKDDLERAQQYTKSVPTAKQEKMRINWYQGPTSNSENVLDFVNNKMYEQVESRYQNDVLKQSKEALNAMIDFYNLSNQISKLDMTKSWEDVYDVAQRLSDIVKDAPIKITEANKQMVDAKKNLEKINYLDLGFNNLNFSDNSSIYTSQKLVEDQIRSMFDQMDLDIWSQFLDINNIDPKDSSEFSNFIQEMLDVVTEENAISITQLFKDFNSGKKTGTEFFDEFIKIAEQSGNSSAIAFANSFQSVLDQQLKNEQEKFKKYLISLGTNEVMADVYSSKLDLGEGQQRQNYIEEYGLGSLKKRSDFFKIPKEALDELEGNVAQAIKDGDLEGLESLPDVWAEKWGIMDNVAADIISYGATADAIEKMIEERANIAFENIGKTASQIFSKKDFSSIGVDEAVNYMRAFGGADNFLKHAKMGDDGKFEIDTYGQVLMLRKQINDEIKIYDGYIADIERLGENITPQEKKQLEYWKKLREEATKQKVTIGDIVDLTEDIKKTVSEIELPKITGGGIASENAKALDLSIDIGKEYENIIDLADKLEKQMKDIGHVDDDIVKELLSYGSAFEDFFVVQDDGTIEMQLQSMVDKYGSAAEAIKDIANKRRLAELEIKKQEMLDEADYSEKKAEAYEQMALIMRQYVQSAIDNEKSLTIGERREKEQQALDQINSISTSLSNVEAGYQAYQDAAEIMYENLEKYDIAYWNSLGPDNIAGTMQAEFKKAAAITASATLNPLELIINKDREGLLEGAETYEQAAKGLREYAARLRAGAEKLKVIDPTVYEKLAGKMEQAGKAGEKAGQAIAKAVADAAEAIIKLNDLLDDLEDQLKDINVDYNPFTDLFEAWEHEWDYYYNIKRLIQQIEDQGKYIDGIISADYTSADQKIAAEQAKVGQLLAAMAANDAYIESLRTGMSQTALELMDEFGEYYKINPDTGQIYQHDTSLNEINNTINQRRQEIYELQKLQNEKENDLSLENAKLDALEQEKSAYEDILSTVESQLDSLRDDDDIIANVSELENEQANIKAKITLTDESIDVLKDVVRNIEDEIQEIEIDITLKEQSVSKLEEYVDKMEDKVSEYEEYWENLNSTIAEQQELLQSITEEYNKYIDTAISTEQDLYNAIVENYQNEINQKKKQYDELKKLDNDYLASVKNSISEERKARDDSNKQKSYQQSLQRAQLLQQDTSGAYRAELAQLNKDIEQQRQDLYDDLVDKQVEALEKEIEKRHELYDKEVAALEERLAYMQENAILLWETVNNIVAEGAENMMSILENTTAYINSNELSKEKQRKQWEYNVKKTFDGVQNRTIDMLNDLIEAGNEYIKDKLPEVGTAVDNYTEVYQDAAHVITNYNELLQNNMWSLFGGTGNEGMFQTILNSFMTTWNNTTNTLTGYSESWQGIVDGLRSATEGNIEALRNMNNQGGSIKELDKALRDSARELYEDFLDERRRYRDELNALVDTIRVEITDAIKAAADAIRSAANSLQVNPSKDNGGTTTSTGGSQPAQSTTQPTTTTTTTGTKTRYKIQVQGGYLAADGTVHTIKETYGGYNSAAAAIEAVRKDLARRREQQKWQNYWHNDLIPIAYAKGGIADYTGPAWLDGTKSQPEAVLNPKQTRLFTSMVSSLEKASNNSNINSPLGSSYNIGDINTTIQVDKLDNQTDINKLARQVEDKIVKDIRNRIPVSVTKGV